MFNILNINNLKTFSETSKTQFFHKICALKTSHRKDIML